MPTKSYDADLLVLPSFANALSAAKGEGPGDLVTILEGMVRRGDTRGNAILGYYYEMECLKCVETNAEIALRYYGYGLSDGWIQCAVGIGRIRLGHFDDAEAAFSYFNIFEDNDLVSPIAEFFLGQLHENGALGQANPAAARSHYRLSASLGYAWGVRAIASDYWRSNKKFRAIGSYLSLAYFAIRARLFKTKYDWTTEHPYIVMGPVFSREAK